MSRVTSATVYGSAQGSLSRVTVGQRRAYGLRSGSSVDGFYGAYGRKPRRSRATVVGADNLVQPAVVIDDDDVRPLRVVTDYAAERALVGTIRMGDLDG